MKIPVNAARCKRRTLEGAPSNPVELLPRIAIINPVEIDDAKLARVSNHHIADMIVAMLKCQRPLI
ncbi:hypothetical protein D3C78_1870330 [compost metagenome]